jgi:hypothetical protein
MKVILSFWFFTATVFNFSVEFLHAQESAGSAEKRLFDSDELLSITIRGDVKKLLNDRTGNPSIRSIILSYLSGDSSEIKIPVEMRTRGHFRKQKGVCTYPPLLIQFLGNEPQRSTIFSEQKKLKLVMPCSADEYVIREWLVYKIYNLVTPLSFRARLVKVNLEDPKFKKPVSPFYGILLEEEDQMAKRSNATAVEEKLKPQQTLPEAFLTMAVFEYMIGNTDWSVQFLQNIKLLKTDSGPVPMTVPYDFDHAGIVDAPYAQPAEQLLMTSVRERRYRGYCVEDLTVFNDVIALFNQLKNDIYNLYTNCRLLDAKSIKYSVQYLDDFYEIINNPKAWQKDFAYPCDPNGTGNVVIKGLREEK